MLVSSSPLEVQETNTTLFDDELVSRRKPSGKRAAPALSEPTTTAQAQNALASRLMVHRIMAHNKEGLGVLLRAELGASVGDADVQLPGALDDLLALARGHVVGDLRRVLPVEE